MLFSQPEMPSARAISPTSVRTVLGRRLSRVRFAWFLLGTAFGVAVSYYLFCLIHHDAQYSRQMNFARAEAALESRLAPLPLLPEPTATIAAAEPSKPEMTLPASYTLLVKRGDTLTSLLTDKGVEQDEAEEIMHSLKHVYNPRDLTAGKAVELHLDKSADDPARPGVSSLTINVSPLKTVTLTRNEDNSFDAREIKAPVFKSLARAGGEIHSSLYQTGVDNGIPAQMLSEIIQAFSYDVDFQRDIREGDSIDVVFERMHTDKDVTAGYGKILYASLTLGDDEYTVYRHVSNDGFAGYYDAKGNSVKKALLKTPINGARITSGFGMRMHPLLGYSKMHKGIDFGAATGTPIYAAGDGVIEEAGRKGGYGNYVRVKHSDRYATAYGHASRIAHGIHPGVHVKQGQVIAYVGSTGFSTGPHLHYEILVNGAQVNPSGVKFRTGQMLAGHELADFKKQVKEVQVALNTLPRARQVASLETH
jgi:murein DD-endopeptidase MepM/ murein hydrolase activator NlpD